MAQPQENMDPAEELRSGQPMYRYDITLLKPMKARDLKESNGGVSRGGNSTHIVTKLDPKSGRYEPLDSKAEAQYRKNRDSFDDELSFHTDPSSMAELRFTLSKDSGLEFAKPPFSFHIDGKPAPLGETVSAENDPKDPRTAIMRVRGAKQRDAVNGFEFTLHYRNSDGKTIDHDPRIKNGQQWP